MSVIYENRPRSKLSLILSLSLILFCIFVTLNGQNNGEAHATLEGTRSYLPMVNRYYPLWGSTGILDPSFGDNGIVTSESINSAEAVVLQEDGKIIITGRTGIDFSVERYNPDGSIDLSFSEDGATTVTFGDVVSACAVALQADGKIVLGGYGYGNFVLARLHPNGNLDTSFGGDGKVATNFFGYDDGISALTIQQDGKIIAAGYAANGTEYSSYDFALARYNPDGSLDTNFSDDGKLTTDFFGNYDIANDIFLLPDGKILVTGQTNDSSKSYIGVVRYYPDGSLDTSFNGSGKVSTSFENGAIGGAITLQSDGKIIVAGEVYTGSSYNIIAVRYNANGSLDMNFGEGGLTSNVFLNVFSYTYDATIQPDDKILVVGMASFFNPVSLESDDDIALVRYNQDGSPDLGFGDEGKVTTNINQVEYGVGTVLQPDGKIVVVGFTKSLPDYSDAIVLRYK